MNRRPNLIPAVVLIVLGLAVGGYGAFRLRQTAALYQATAGVRVIRDQTDLAPLPDSFPAGLSDSVLLQNQIEVIQSETVLVKVIEKLDLNRAWGNEFGVGTVLKTAESAALLRERVTVSQQPGASVLQIAARDKNPAQAQLLANTLAEAFCEARLEQRRRVAQEALTALEGPFQENDAKYQKAAALVTQARAALDPAIRAQNPPPAPTQSDALDGLLQDSARLTMAVMMQSNQLARSQSLPTEELQKLVAKFTRTTNQWNETEARIQAETQKLAALNKFWDAQQELERANTVLIPLQKAMAAHRHTIADTNNPPAVVAEPATNAVKQPGHNPVALGCLIGALGLGLGGVWLLGRGNPTVKA